MEDQIGHNRHQKFELQAALLSYIANCAALLLFFLWTALVKDPVYSIVTLVLSSLALTIVSLLFLVLRHYKPKESVYRKYLYNNFYVLLFLFSMLTIISIFKL